MSASITYPESAASGPRCKPGLISRARPWRDTNQLGEILIGFDGQIDEADHHLVPGLIAEADRGFRIWIELVPRRVVENGGRFEFRAFREHPLLGQVVG